VSQLFKGIALFTPGGDLIYCVDSSKRSRWHIHLCFGLQDLLDLPEAPHFLVPGYTAVVDRWLDTQTKQIKTIAEIYPPVQRDRALLNAVFGLDRIDWQIAPWQEQYCNPSIIETYRDRFPQLWENHDAIVRLNWQDRPNPSAGIFSSLEETQFDNWDRPPTASIPFGIATLNSTQQLEKQIESGDRLVNYRESEADNSNAYVLRLFVSGDRYATEKTLLSIHQLLEQELGRPYTLKTIDISKHPELAEKDRISATPALVRIWPKPVRRIVGDLNDFQRVLQILTSL
jgi:circadian clock protein KaiB